METVHSARDAGCEYMVAPTTDVSLIETCNQLGLPMLAGALSPDEILLAWKTGSPLVKVFPGDAGGPKWLKDLSGPLPQIDLLPTGGITPENAASYLSAGATALGVGSAIAPKAAILDRNWDEIRDVATSFVAAISP